MTKRDEIAEIIRRAMLGSKAWPVVFEAGSAAELTGAALAALDAARFVVAPKEPTPEMAAQGFIADDCADPMAIYRAMIEARP